MSKDLLTLISFYFIVTFSAFSSATAFILLSASAGAGLVGVNFSAEAYGHGISGHFGSHMPLVIPASGHTA